jgi:hypothetical protein
MSSCYCRPHYICCPELSRSYIVTFRGPVTSHCYWKYYKHDKWIEQNICACVHVIFVFWASVTKVVKIFRLQGLLSIRKTLISIIWQWTTKSDNFWSTGLNFLKIFLSFLQILTLSSSNKCVKVRYWPWAQTHKVHDGQILTLSS